MGLRLHSHLSEDANDVSHCLEVHGLRPVEYAAENGFLDRDVWLAHLVHVSEGELAMLAQTGAGMAHCPQSNARMGSGIAPASRLAAMGGQISLGVDGAASNESCDMISEMHAAWRMQRAVGGPDAATVEQVVNWATSGGAQALGFPPIGRIEIGMQADLVLFELSHPRYAGLHDPLAGPLICGGAAKVRHLLRGGHSLVQDGAIVGVDYEALSRAAAATVARLRLTVAQ